MDRIEEGVRRIGNTIKRLLARRASREDLHKQHLEHLPMV
jgi:hypothetical protein